MKQLRHFFLLMLAICAFSLNAQTTTGGSDVLLLSTDADVNTKSEVLVAKNGMMYVVVATNDEGNTAFNIFCSKDYGENYQLLNTVTPSEDGATFADIDVYVSGEYDAEIVLWVAKAINNADGSGTILLDQYNNDGEFLDNAYEQNYPNTTMVSVGIDGNDRSYNDLNSIGVAYSCYTEEESKLGYFYALNIGSVFNHKWIYTVDESDYFGKLDIAIGIEQGIFPYMGVVFETNPGTNNADIGFLANYVDYDNNYKWESPIYFDNPNYSNPKISWFANFDLVSQIGGQNRFNFMIGFNSVDSNGNIDIVYSHPLSTFIIFKNFTPTLNDLEVKNFANDPNINEYDINFSYDKNFNNYLVTYIEENTSDNTVSAIYRWINYQVIDDAEQWDPEIIYSQKSTTKGIYSNPSVDINSIKQQATWVWEEIQETDNKKNIYTDGEWFPISDDNDDFNDSVYITLTAENAGDIINLGFVAENDGTKVRIVGAETTDIEVGISWYPTNGYKTDENAQLVIYGDLLGFDCSSNNKVTNLDFEHNNTLKELSCHSNKISELNISGMIYLESVYCGLNNMRSIILDGCVSLRDLSMASNNLSDIDLSKCTAIKSVDISSNKITTLDLSGLDNIQYVWCENNPFTVEGLDLTYCNLPDFTDIKEAIIYPIEKQSDFNANEVLATNSQNALDRSWKVLYWENDAVVETTGDYLCSGESIEDANLSDNIRIYPNPAEDIIYIDGVAVKEVHIFDTMGKLVSIQNTSTLNVSSLTSGVYMLDIKSTDGDLHRTKIVVR